MSKPRSKKGRYPVIDGLVTVELQLDYLSELFDELDPSPIRRKDLDDDVERYINSSFHEIPLKAKKQLVIYLPEQELIHTKEEDIGRAIDAIHNFYRFESNEKRKEIRRILKVGLKSLVIGSTFLIFSVWISYISSKMSIFDSKFLSSLLKEGLVLLGWVSMWKPVNIFLYEWWPMLEMKKLYDELSLLKVLVKSP